MPPFRRACAAAFGVILLVASAAKGDTPVVFSATGADVPATVAAFRTAIGGVNNGNAREMQASGRREINWEDAPDSATSPNGVPFDFYFATVPRQAWIMPQIRNPIRVSAAPGNAAGTPSSFGDVDPAYATYFAPYSGQRLAGMVRDPTIPPNQQNQFLVIFVVPGTAYTGAPSAAPASVSAFGMVFNDVNLPNVTSIQFRGGIGFEDFGTYYVPPTSGHGQSSFLGVMFPTERVTSVVITLGTSALEPGNTLEDSTHDLVAVDDMIYAEPLAQSYSISDATVQEGDAGTTDAIFTVTRSSLTLPTPMDLGYFLTAGTATRNVDYLDLNGDRGVRFAPGSYTSTITVKVVGDQDIEPNETFLVHLEAAAAIVSTKSVGLGTIVDDDAGGTPSLTITQPTAAPTFDAKRPFVTVAGSTLSTQPVTKVTWANDRGGSGTADGTTNWSIPNLALQPGVNQITVAATDAVGNTATNALTVNAAPSYYLAEGSTGSFFHYDLSIANPNDSSAPVALTFQQSDGTIVSSQTIVGALSQTTVHVDDIPGLESTAMSTVVTSSSGLPLVVERTMFWDHTYYAGSAAVAVSAPRTEWRFAEGVENSFFDTFVLLQNPNSQPTTATVTFLLEATPPVAPISVNLTLPPQSRTTLDAGSVAGLAGYSFGIAVSGSLPIVVERATYFGTTLPTRVWDGGDGSPGVTDPASTWLFAEGSTGPATDTYFVVANNDTVAQDVTFTFYLDTGEVVTKVKTIPAQSRYTMPVDTEDPKLANATFATRISGSPQIVAEREIYWQGTTSPYTDSTSVFGVNAPGTKWGFAEGRVGGPLDFHSYILLGNMNATPADVKVTYLRTDGTTIVKTYNVAATSRVTVDVGMTSGLVNESFGTIVESTNGVPIVTERAMYWTPGSILFDGAIATTGTRLP